MEILFFFFFFFTTISAISIISVSFFFFERGSTMRFFIYIALAFPPSSVHVKNYKFSESSALK